MKKITLFLLTTVLCLWLPVTTRAAQAVASQEAPAQVRGDLNGDGFVDVTDLGALINILLGKAQFIPAADLTGDSMVDITDVSRLIDIILGKVVDDVELIDITFAGQGENGATPVIDRIDVTNVATGATVTLGGNDILRLRVRAGADKLRRQAPERDGGGQSRRITVAPAVSFGDARLTFEATVTGLATIEVLDREGRVVSSSTVYAPAGRNTPRSTKWGRPLGDDR